MQIMEAIGNEMANSVWEERLNFEEKPNHDSNRNEKEKFIQNKYMFKSFTSNVGNKESACEDLLVAITNCHMKTIVKLLVHHSDEICTQFSSDENLLTSLLTENTNVGTAQLLIWLKNDNGVYNSDEEKEADVDCNESVLL